MEEANDRKVHTVVLCFCFSFTFFMYSYMFCLVCQPFSTGVQHMDAGFQVASS